MGNPVATSAEQFALPTEVTPPLETPSGVIAHIYGESGIGKTTFCSQIPKALFIATEPGHHFVAVHRVEVQRWEQLVGYLASLASGGHDFENVVFDTVHKAYDMCLDYVCAKHNMLHPSDKGHGKGWGLVNSEFRRVINKLANLGLGVFFISNLKTFEQDTRTGKLTVSAPSLSGSARDTINQLADFILFFHMVAAGSEEHMEQVRVMETKNSPLWEAKDRTGYLPDNMPIDYPTFHDAFVDAVKKRHANFANSANTKKGAAK